MKRIHVWRRQFSWRMLLVRMVVNAIALILTAALVPRIYFVDPSLWRLLFVAAVLGALNAFVKPVIQFATLRFIFATYGVVVAVINGVILLMLGLLLPRSFAVDGLVWALVGGGVLGILSSVFENLLGLTPPIVSDRYPEIRRGIREREAESVDRRLPQIAEDVETGSASSIADHAGAPHPGAATLEDDADRDAAPAVDRIAGPEQEAGA